MRPSRYAVALLALACAPAEPGPPKPGLLPFPSLHHLKDGRVHPDGTLPAAATPIPVERWATRTGFSPVQTVVVDLGLAIDPTSLPGLDQIGEPGSVRLWDLTAEAHVPCFAELDAFPDQPDASRRLLIRPAAPMTPGHQIAVVITTEVRTATGEALPVVPWFAALLDGRPHETLVAWEPAYTSLAERLRDAGLPEPALAFEFPISDGTETLRAMLRGTELPTAYTFTDTLDADGDELPSRAWRRLSGTFTTVDWLGEAGQLTLDPNGAPIPQGTVQAALEVYLPQSVRDATAGTAPVWLFGHGIFASPDVYLNYDDDESAVQELADRAGAIVIATTWRGLTTTDLGVPLGVAGDFGRFPELTDHLAQGVANAAALVKLIQDGDLLDDPLFAGLADRSTLRYYGISLGGIEGAVLTSQTPALSHAVLHVGGSTWSTMLERSVHWTLFEDALLRTLPDPGDRQLAYAASQLFWDPVDPANYTDDLRERSVLFQLAVGDDQVPNLSTYTLARGVGATVLSPSPHPVAGLSEQAAPGTPAIALFDPEQGNDEASNRPATDTTSHETPRTWEGAKLQVLRFLEVDDPGMVEHFCGATPCTPARTGP